MRQKQIVDKPPSRFGVLAFYPIQVGTCNVKRGGRLSRRSRDAVLLRLHLIRESTPVAKPRVSLAIRPPKAENKQLPRTKRHRKCGSCTPATIQEDLGSDRRAHRLPGRKLYKASERISENLRSVGEDGMHTESVRTAFKRDRALSEILVIT